MNEKRIYVIVPQTVQVVHKRMELAGELSSPATSCQPEVFEDSVESFPMVHGRLIAQGVHVGRFLERMFVNSGLPYQEITTITLCVRNSKELTKVSNEARSLLGIQYPTGSNGSQFYGEFHDHNPGFYGTENRIHTITAFGPTTKEIMESAIGHLNLY